MGEIAVVKIPLKVFKSITSLRLQLVFTKASSVTPHILPLSLEGSDYGDGAGGSEWSEGQSHRGVRPCAEVLPSACFEGMTSELWLPVSMETHSTDGHPCTLSPE